MGIHEGHTPTPEDLDATLYRELRRLAERHMARERSGHTLQATALVHEAFLKMAHDRGCPWEREKGFFLAAAEAMRRVLLDHARRKQREKRGGRRERLALDVADLAVDIDLDDVLSIDESITVLRDSDPRAAEVVLLRFYAGLPFDEISELLGLSDRTVKRDWRFARAWLYERLSAGAGGP